MPTSWGERKPGRRTIAVLVIGALALGSVVIAARLSAEPRPETTSAEGEAARSVAPGAVPTLGPLPALPSDSLEPGSLSPTALPSSTATTAPGREGDGAVVPGAPGNTRGQPDPAGGPTFRLPMFGPGPDESPGPGTQAPDTPTGTNPSTEPTQAPSAAPTTGSEPSARLAPVYSSSTTFFGAALSGSDGSIAEALAINDRLFGRMAVVRQFDPTVPPAGAWSRRRGLHDRVISTSFREPPAEILAGRHDARLLAHFREAPTRRPIFWTYFHEPEPHINRGEFTHAEYRQAWRHVVRLAAQAKKKNLYPTLVLTGWTADPASKRNWRDYYPGDDYISVVAWDPYNSATSRPTSYREPAQLFAHVLKASRASGKPWAIAETGTMLVRGDDGTGRAAWLTKMGNYFDREGAAFVTYFQSTRDGDFKLTDKASISAWAQFVKRSA